jgi:hypothetical protein
MYWDRNYDGIFGLSPRLIFQPLEAQVPESANILLYLSTQSTLEPDTFSLSLPRDLDDEGEITFGGINPDRYTRESKNANVGNKNGEIHPSLVRWRLERAHLWHLITLDTADPFLAHRAPGIQHRRPHDRNPASTRVTASHQKRNRHDGERNTL